MIIMHAVGATVLIPVVITVVLLKIIKMFGVGIISIFSSDGKRQTK